MTRECFIFQRVSPINLRVGAGVGGLLHRVVLVLLNVLHPPSQLFGEHYHRGRALGETVHRLGNRSAI